jgi:Protein of unknown function (DUF3060)
MEPHGDPEARIRDLERPLSDPAHTPEAAAAPRPWDAYEYATPPPVTPPPAYNYGGGAGPFPPSTKPKSSRLFLILACVFVVLVLAIVGVVAALIAHQFSDRGSDVASPTAATSPNMTAPRRTPVMPSFSIPSIPAIPGIPGTGTQSPGGAPSTPPAGTSVIVSGVNESRTLACTDNNVTVSGVNMNVTISGHCTTLAVTGMQNVITMDTADTIDVSGINNKVTWHSGSPKVSNSGLQNTVRQG